MENGSIDLSARDVADEALSAASAVRPNASVCIASSDPVWSGLRSQHLSARGWSSSVCLIPDLPRCIEALNELDWVIIDGGWPTVALQDSLDSLAPRLTATQVKTVMIVDDLIGSWSFSAITADKVIRRSSDMRVLVRELLALFSLSPV